MLPKRVEWMFMTNPGSGVRIPTGARRRALRVGAPLTVLAMIAAGTAQSAEAASATAAAHTPTAVGTVAKAPAGATSVAAPSDSTQTTVSLLLNPRNPAALQQYADSVSDPKSPMYKHYLSAQQAAAEFAPSQATVDAVEAALSKAGLTPGAVGGDNLDIQLTATLGQLKSAFGVGFAGYRLANGRTAYSATSAPKLDGTVAPMVEGVLGLDDFIQHSADDASVYGKAAVSAATTPATVRPTSAATAPQMCSQLADGLANFNTGNGTEDLVDGTNYYSPASLDTVYGLNGQLTAGNTGAGQTVAVVEWENVSKDAVGSYMNCYGLHNQITYTSVDGGPYTAASPSNGVGIEAALDLETLASLAPGANIIDYAGPDGTGPKGAVAFTDADWLDTMMAPVTADKAGVISMSWSAGCDAETESDPALRTGETDILQLAATQGQTFVNSSGDYGSTECSNSQTSDPTVSPADPADNPYVLGVGGTYDQGITSVSTTTWNESALEAGASGGGASDLYAMTDAANYQAGFTAPGYSSACGISGGSVCRQSPDVSALADPQSGFPIIVDSTSTNPSDGFYYTVEGGTSWSAPIVAAMAALTDDTPACESTGPLGFVNPAMYALASNASDYAADFTDVTTGNNAYTPDNATNTLFQATTGYDMATGLGVLGMSGWSALCAGAKSSSTPLYVLGPNKASVQEWTGSAWLTIGGPAGNVYAGGAGVFASSPDGKSISKYDGSPNMWTQVGGAGKTFVVSGDTLYGLSPTGTSIARFNGAPGSWSIVGGAAQSIYSAGNGVFATSPGNAAILKYTPGGGWARVGGAGSQFATSGDKLFGLAPNASAILEWTGSGQNWTRIGGPLHAIYAGGLGLFATNPGKTGIYQYNSASGVWTNVGPYDAAYAVGGKTLYAQSAVGAPVYVYSGTPQQWTNIGGTPVALAAG
jgi:subtilase family serine protease